MTITYSDGRAREAVLLSQTEDSIRVAIQDTDDVTELRNINGIWVSEDCEPAHIQFAWQKRGHKPTISPVDCCCSRELATRLMRLLFTSSSEDGAIPATIVTAAEVPPLSRNGGIAR